jgi:hypothetical protein
MRHDVKTEFMRAGLACCGASVHRRTFLIVLALAGTASIGIVAQEPPRTPGSKPRQIGPDPTALDREIALQEQLSAAPNSIDVLVQLAELLARNGLHSASTAYWQRASKVRPADSSVRLSVALELMEAGRNDEAVAELPAIAPQSAVVLTNLGAALAGDNRLSGVTPLRQSLRRMQAHITILRSVTNEQDGELRT